MDIDQLPSTIPSTNQLMAALGVSASLQETPLSVTFPRSTTSADGLLSLQKVEVLVTCVCRGWRWHVRLTNVDE